MPQPVALQYSDQSVGLPANYTLPPGQAFDFSSVTARINGAGASGAFLVVLDLLSQDDKVIASSRIDQEFAAGDTGVVSFAPDFRRRVTSTTPPPSGSVISVARYRATAFALGVGPTVIDWDLSSTYDPSGHFGISAGNDPTILDAGVYYYDLVFGGFSMAASDEFQVTYDMNETSGGPGRYSSQPAGAASEAFGEYALLFDADGGTDMRAGAGQHVGGFVVLDSTRTFPTVLQVAAGVVKNGVDVAATGNFQMTIARWGDVDE